MNIEEIMTHIQETGLFHYSPSSWSEALDKELKQKIADGTLQTVEMLGMDFHNAAFYYVLGGNPRNVIPQFNGRYSYLAPTLTLRDVEMLSGISPRTKEF